jgi:cyclopropane fatty-acyl-phospholipid synthase-like methyltransferase
MWSEIGELQIGFLKSRGLSPHHRLLDMGCGALRGGVHFVRYLDVENYYGLDINASLVEAGKWELERLRLVDKRPKLLVNDGFKASTFGISFDYAVAVSLFTHLHLNQIARCLVEVKEALKREGEFYATFFEAPSSVHLESIKREPGKSVTNFDTDPFHYSKAEMEWLAQQVSLSVELVGEWGHPRGQRMLCFRHTMI